MDGPNAYGKIYAAPTSDPTQSSARGFFDIRKLSLLIKLSRKYQWIGDPGSVPPQMIIAAIYS